MKTYSASSADTHAHGPVLDYVGPDWP
jgi:hypothetical protein